MTQLTELATELEHDQSRLAEELAEIELLMRQASSEAERHETRRVEAEQRLTTLDNDPRADPGALGEARAQLMSQTRRQTMMQGQLEVLQGKQRALQRYHERLQQIVPVLAATTPHSDGTGDAVDSASSPASESDEFENSSGPFPQLLPGEDANGNGPSPANSDQPRTNQATPRDVMAAQEEMRREIARQMHDGPAQSIANIALQAQVVQLLAARDPRQTETEVKALLAMVQSALEATKNFIFDVRPMVLDDLGLVPTLRRSAAERSRRTGQPVGFESAGTDKRLGTELESALFRIIDDAVQGMLEARPEDLLVRLDWQEPALRATVRGRAPGAPAEVDAAKAAVAAARRDKEMPAALASMIHEQESVQGHGMSERVWSDIRDRADPVGIDVSLSDDGWVLEARVSYRR